MGDFNNYKLFKNVGIRSSDNKLIVMNVNKSNNVSFYSSDGGTNNIDVMSINSIINKSQNEDLNLSSLTGNKINPVITINNNHGDCRIMTNLNVAGNVNVTKNLDVSNTIVSHNLIIPKYDNNNSLLSSVIGSIYYNTTENMYEGYSNEGWQPLGGFSKTKDATIHKNLNVLQNINCTDKITSNINLVKHNLIIPTHTSTESSLLSNVQGSIYFNTSEKMYEGYVSVSEGWQPLGGFSKTKDATIHKNLNVNGNINVDTINEKTNNTGVTIENILLKDTNVTAHTISAQNYSVGGTNFISASRQGNFRDLEVKDNANNTTILLSGGTNGVSGGDISITGILSVDTIKENTNNTGVTIENILLKDGAINTTNDTTIGANLNVLGNLNITGNMNQINSTQITVNDKNIVLASNNNADNHIEDGGLILQGTTQKTLLWKSAEGWSSSEKITAPCSKIGIGTFNTIDSGSGLIKTTGQGSFGSIQCGIGTFNTIDSGSGLIKTTGQGSFNSIQCGIGTFTKIDTTESQLIIGNSQVELNLNFSGNNLHINGNVPTAGQILMSNGSEVKWANTDNSLINNQLIKVVTEIAGSDIFSSASVLDLSSSNSYTQTYITHTGYTLNNDTKKIIIIFNFAVVDSNLVSKIKLEVLINDVSKKSVIFKNMTGNQINDFVKYFTLTSTEYGTGSKTIKFKFTDMDNTGTIKIFTEDGLSVKQPTITLQEIGDQNIRTILNETRGSKTDQIAKVLVNTNATATKQTLNTSQATNYIYPYELHSSYTPSVSDTGTIIIIVNFTTYISFNNNLTSKLKLELLLNNGSDTTIPQERKIILQEMNSNRSYEYTKYFSISKTAFGTNKKIELRFTDMNNSGNITLFTNDGTNVKQPTVTIQEIGSTTGWGSAINDIPIGQTTSADASFNKVVVKHNLDVSGNVNIIGNGIINTSLGIGTTSLNNGFTGFNTHTNSILDINGQTTIRGHILPSQNAQFDLGNAEYKIRHLFLSDNSLWIGDKHKIDVSDGTIKFRKRKTGIPKTILNAGGNADDAKSNSGKGNISDLTLQDWHNYAKTLNHETIGGGVGKAKIEDIFKTSETDDWDENDTTMDKLVINNNIDVSGNLNITTFQPNVSSGISITNRSKKRWGIRVNGVTDTVSYMTDGAPDQNLDKYGGVKKYAAYYNDSHMARYLGMTQTALDSAKNGGSTIDVDVYNSDGVFIRQDNIIMSSTLENAVDSSKWPLLKNSTSGAVWEYDEYIRGRNVNPIGSYVGIGTTNSEYELSVHGQVHILGTGHQRGGFGEKDFWPLKITLDGNTETNVSVPGTNNGPPDVKNWVGMGAGHGNGSGWWADRNPIQWESLPRATVATGLDALYFTTKQVQLTGFVQASSHSFANLLSFTGQHRNVPNNIDLYNNIDNYIGYIVYSTGNYKTYNYDEETLKTDKNAITINDSLPEIALSNKKQQKSVFGVLSNKEEEERTLTIGNFHTPYPNINDDKRLYVNSMGEGAIWIVNTNGNLENGDYIQSSDVIGMGEKQDSEFLANYTVAKITCDCNFDTNSTKYNCVEFVDATSGNTYKKAFVGCTYHCG